MNPAADLISRIIGPNDGELLGDPAWEQDRFLVSGAETGGRLALVEHRLAPRALAAPMHRHAREDEFSWIIAGEVGFSAGGRDVVARAGELVVKPRGEWHTFWNAGEGEARILEVISPAGLEQLFRRMGLSTEAIAPEQLAEMAAEFGCEIDFAATGALVQARDLVF